jgi:hypothetical protein
MAPCAALWSTSWSRRPADSGGRPRGGVLTSRLLEAGAGWSGWSLIREGLRPRRRLPNPASAWWWVMPRISLSLHRRPPRWPQPPCNVATAIWSASCRAMPASQSRRPGQKEVAERLVARAGDEPTASSSVPVAAYSGRLRTVRPGSFRPPKVEASSFHPPPPPLPSPDAGFVALSAWPSRSGGRPHATPGAAGGKSVRPGPPPAASPKDEAGVASQNSCSCMEPGGRAASQES